MNSKGPGYKWAVVAMLWFVCFFNYADRQAIFAVFPKLKEEFGFDKVQLGLIGSAFMWVYAAGAPLAGFIGDRVARRHLILGGCLFWSFVTVTTGWCSKLWHFVTVRALEGFGETFYFPASMSLTSDYHGPATRSRALSFHQSSVYVGTILGSWAGAYLAETVGWRMGFYVFGSLGMVLALVLYAFLIEPKRGQSESTTPATPVPVTGAPETPSPTPPQTAERPLGLTSTLRAIFRNPAVPFLMLAFVGANFVATIFLTWTPTFLVEKFGFRLSSAGLSGTVFIHLASACSVPFAGWLADRMVRRSRAGRMLVQATGLLVGAVFVFLVGDTTNRHTLLIAMAAFGTCKGFYDSGIFASLYDAVEPRARGTAAGLMNTVGWGGGALGPVFVGLASKYGGRATEVENMSAAISLGAAVYVVAAAMVLIAAVLFARRTPSCDAHAMP
jgi:MFS family permease